MDPAARLGDLHTCPVHGISPVLGPGGNNVFIGDQIAARKTDFCMCPTSGPDPILDGSPTVLIRDQPAARFGERCSHGGTVIGGCFTVLIGNPAIGPDGRAISIPDECKWIFDFGQSVDANPNAPKGGKLDRLRDGYQTKSTEMVNKAPPGETTPLEYKKSVVTIRGHDVTIYEPTSPPPNGQWLPNTDNAAKGLATLSDEQLAGMKEVYLVPHDYPPRHSDVANHSNGVIQFFPRAKPHPQSDIDWVFQHESAHNVWDKEVAKDPNFKSEWQRAADMDHRKVSDYGETGIGEDFADFQILYSNVLGTPCEASARALFPNRFKIMDRLYPKGFPVRNPPGSSRPY
jgi:uncharacterized Zn-binding protein involved in type VI secretion